MIQVNLPNKSNKDTLNDFAQVLWEHVPNVDICLHWSVKNRKLRTAQETHKTFINDVTSPPAGVSSFLLVSGSVVSSSLDSITCLKELAGSRHQHAEIGVAFNPYFPDVKEREREQQRLKEKVATGCVSHVWLQFGSNMELLREGLRFLQVVRTASSTASPFKIFGSFFVPSKKFLAQVLADLLSNMFEDMGLNVFLPSDEVPTMEGGVPFGGVLGLGWGEGGPGGFLRI